MEGFWFASLYWSTENWPVRLYPVFVFRMSRFSIDGPF